MKRKAYICLELLTPACAKLQIQSPSCGLRWDMDQKTHVKIVHPISHTMMQILGWIFKAIMLEGICIMAKAIVYITGCQMRPLLPTFPGLTEADRVLVTLHVQFFFHAGDV